MAFYQMMMYGFGIGGLIFRWLFGSLILAILVLLVVWLAKKIRE